MLNKEKSYNFKKKIFVFEGIDGVGKTTLAYDINEKLNNAGIKTIVLSFPGKQEGSLGNLVYQLHHNSGKYGINNMSPLSMQIMHIAAHVDCIINQIIPAIEDGFVVLLDRFWWSTVAYGLASGINKESIDTLVEVEKGVWGEIVPQKIFYISAEVLFKNELAKSEKIELIERYNTLINLENKQNHIEVIDNNDFLVTSQNVFNQIFQCLKNENTHSFNHTLKPMTAKSNLGITIYKKWLPSKVTEVFDTYWKFAKNRQDVFFRRLHHCSFPYTDDLIIQQYKFTNVYRVTDRVSQYLINEVINKGEQSEQEVFFRIILFKLFNKIETWEHLLKHFGEISYQKFNINSYDKFLMYLKDNKQSIYSAAYIMPSGGSNLGSNVKHRNHLHLLEIMMEDEVYKRISDAKSLMSVFEILKSYPTIGDFLAFQYAIDLNYSNLIDFSEMSFVVPGPGARDGIHKCFSDLGGLSEVDIIKLMADKQEEEFKRLNLDFKDLWGRPLQLIDCQNIFCEVDKYSRIAHPAYNGLSGRTRIKQKFKPNSKPMNFSLPDKWGLKYKIENR